MRPSKLLFVALAALSVAAPSHAEAWKHTLAPYFWGISFDADMTIRGNEADGDGSDDGDAGIMDHIESAGLLRYAGHGDKWGITADALYVGLGYPSVNTAAEADLDATVLEVDGTWRANEHFQVLFGVRYYDISGDIDFAILPDVEGSQSWFDAVAGLRVEAPLGDHWSWYGRGDIGAGGSDFAWNAETAFLWNATDHFSLVLGWRTISTDYEEGDGADKFAMDATINGPLLGFAFRW